MLQKLLFYLQANRSYLIRYFLVGMSGFLLDIGLLYIFKQFFGFRPVLAVVINQIIVLSYIFLVNKFFSFQQKGDSHAQIVKFLVVMGFNYLVAVGWMWFFSEKLGFNYLIVRTANIALSVGWNFWLYREWVYINHGQ